jgi:membrane fusion protein (multidrug efflux system)
VKITLDPNPALGSLVRPGMSVETTIDTGARSDAPPTVVSTEKPASGQSVGGK